MQLLRSHKFFGLLLLVACANPLCAQTTWKATQASISFEIKNFGATVNGSFKSFSGQLTFNPDALAESSLSGSVDAATINTGNNSRDNHLRRDDYFDVEKYKRIEIHSRKLYKKGTTFAGLFDITIKNVTKQQEILFSFKPDNKQAIFTADFTINRRDFGVGGNSLVLSDDVKINIVITASN